MIPQNLFLHKKGTAKKGTSRTCICGSYIPGLSDHDLVHCVRKLRGGIKHQHKDITSRQLKNLYQEAFLSHFSEIDREVLVANAQGIVDAVCKWTEIFALILEKHAPT